jgi:hypothetical protein
MTEKRVLRLFETKKEELHKLYSPNILRVIIQKDEMGKR